MGGSSRGHASRIAYMPPCCITEATLDCSIGCTMSTKNKHDGVRSRKFLTTIVTLTVTWLTATVGWMSGKMDAHTWVSFNQFVIPLVLGVYSAANVMEKKHVAKD